MNYYESGFYFLLGLSCVYFQIDYFPFATDFQKGITFSLAFAIGYFLIWMLKAFQKGIIKYLEEN